MTQLQVRRPKFDFGDDVQFMWNPGNPAFSFSMNATSFIAICFEQMIVAAVQQAKPLITDASVAEEATAFLRQEAQHSSSHRKHVTALIRRYPGLQETLDAAVASFDEVTATTSLEYRLAYIADLEATFTPSFKLMLDHEQTLFRPGDERVASLFLWHFVEEVEHRSSALVIYDAVVGQPWYRMRVAPSIFRHVWSAVRVAAEGFNKHVPLENRKVDAITMFGMRRRKKALLQRLPLVNAPNDGPFANAFGHLRLRDTLVAVSGIVRSQIPGHNPVNENLPALANEWFNRYDAGYDVTRW